MEQTKPHHGRNIKRFREWFDIKQETLASELNWSQQKVSLLEQREEIEDDVLEEVAKILKVPVETIKNFVVDKYPMLSGAVNSMFGGK